MTIWGLVVLDFIGIVLLIWLVNLIRLGRLYVGYGIVFLAAIAGTMVLISVPFLLNFVTHLVGAVFPASALTLLALGFTLVMLIYILIQITTLSDRLSQLIRQLAIQQASPGNQESDKAPPASPKTPQT